MSREAMLLVNRKARRGQVHIDLACDRLSAGGLKLIEEPSDRPQEISSIIKRHSRRAELVILGGGDGTLNRALDGLLEAKLPLGILPLGTANDLAHSLHLPTELLAACDVILDGHTRKIDVGCVNGRHFLNVASIGLAVEVTRRLTRQTKSRWGKLAYLVAVIQALIRTRPFTAEICSEGDCSQTRTIQIAVGNGRYYGGGLTIDEDAQIDEGKLHLYSLEVERWWHILPLIPALWRGTFEPVRAVRTLHGNRIQVRPLKRPRSITADGELIGTTPAEFHLLPKALTVFVPIDGK